MENQSTDKQFLTQSMRPALAAKTRLQVDKVTGDLILLYPEGVLLLNKTGAEIVQLCDGQRTITQIVAELAQRYQITPEILKEDIGEYLTRLYRQSLLELQNSTHTEGTD